MLGLLIAVLAQVAAPLPPPPDPALTRLAALYDEVCLQAFPIDAAVDKLMADKGATPLSADQVKVTLRDDPGRGWLLADGDRHVQIMLELPPFHACSTRRFVAGAAPDAAAFRAVADRFEAAHPTFAPGSVMDRDMGALHVHGVSDQRPLLSGGAEALMVIDQHAIDPSTHARTGADTEYRFVHQIVSPDAR